MRRQCSARLGAVAGHYVQGASRNACLECQGRNFERAQGRVFCRLDDAGIAHRERWRHGAAEHLDGVVPRDDVGCHAVRLAHDLHGVTRLKGDDLPQHLVGSPAVVLEIPRQHFDVVARGGDGLSGVERLDPGQAFKIPQHQLRQAQQHAASLSCARLSPLPLQGGTCGTYCGIDVRSSARGKPAQKASVRGTASFDVCVCA
jgi:hypothetical protein